MSGEDVCAAAFLRFYTGANVRKQAVLPEARGIRWTDELAADGVGSFTVPRLASALQTTPDLLEDGICKIALTLSAGAAPTEVFAFEMQPTSGTVVGTDLASETLTCTGPGLRNLLTRGVVWPEVGGWDRNTEDARLFGWMSAESATYWYDSADWTAPSSYGNVTSKRWPRTDCAMMTVDLTPAIGDVNLFRSAFIVSADSRVRIWWLGDDETELYVNSELVATAQAGATTNVTTLNLSAGTHTIAARVSNSQGDELKFACCVATVDAANRPVTTLRRSDTTHWDAKKIIASNEPGWTAAAILLKLLSEASAQSVEGLSWLTPDFTKSLDSSGASWTELHDAKAFPTGQTTLLDVVRELEELAFDLHIKPNGTVQAFKTQGVDKTSSVVLRRGSPALLGLDYQGTPVRATKALVRALAGWTTATNSAGVTAYGNRYVGITAGTLVSTKQGALMATRLLADLARARYTYTARMRAVTGMVPFSDFKKGDTITCLNRSGDLVPMRVLSISGETPEDVPGPVTFTLELDES